VQVDQGRRGRHLACGCGRRLLGLRLRCSQSNVHARGPANEHEGPCALPHRLSRL